MMKLARVLGVVVQAIVLGTLLFMAVAMLLNSSGAVRIFQYQGF